MNKTLILIVSFFLVVSTAHASSEPKTCTKLRKTAKKLAKVSSATSKIQEELRNLYLNQGIVDSLTAEKDQLEKDIGQIKTRPIDKKAKKTLLKEKKVELARVQKSIKKWIKNIQKEAVVLESKTLHMKAHSEENSNDKNDYKFVANPTHTASKELSAGGALSDFQYAIEGHNMYVTKQFIDLDTEFYKEANWCPEPYFAQIANEFPQYAALLPKGK